MNRKVTVVGGAGNVGATVARGVADKSLADVVIAPSQEMRDTFVNDYGCRPDRVEVIEHGVNLTRFDPAQVDGGGVRAELGLEEKLVIGAVSKHFWVKNLPALVRAFASIADFSC